MLEQCKLGPGEFQCNDPAPGGTFEQDLPAGTTTLDLAAWCDSACPYGAGPLYDFAAVIYSSTVTIREDGVPVASVPVASGLSNGWVTAGAGSLAFGGSDQLGLRSVGLVEGDGAVVTRDNGACVDWSVRPCAEASAGGSAGFAGSAVAGDLGALSDGEHVLRTRAADAAGNVTLSAPLVVRIDRTAPVAEGLTGGGMASASTRTLDWGVPGGGSAVVSARVRLCTGAAFPATDCSWQAAPAEGPYAFDIGGDGRVASAQVELTDAAGNVGLSGETPFMRDARAPAAPGLAIARSAGPQRTLNVTKSDADVASYIVRLCQGDACTETRQAATGSIALTLPGYGLYRVEVQLVDQVGNVGGAGTIAVDYQAGQDTPTKRPLVLSVTTPSRLGTRSMLVKGKVTIGAAQTIKVTLSGHRRGRKRAVTSSKTVRPSATGKWSVRVKLPARIVRKTGVLVTVRATPTAAYLAADKRKRVKP